MQRLEDDEADLTGDIERRGEPRGSYTGLRVRIDAPGVPPDLAVQEASGNAFFAQLPDPDAVALGSEHAADLSYRGKSARVRAVAVRKELEPRTGIAFRISATDPSDLRAFHDLLGIV
jgi:hypothetical protein